MPGKRKSAASSSSFGAMVKDGVEYHRVQFGSNGERRNEVSSRRVLGQW